MFIYILLFFLEVISSMAKRKESFSPPETLLCFPSAPFLTSASGLQKLFYLPCLEPCLFGVSPLTVRPLWRSCLWYCMTYTRMHQNLFFSEPENTRMETLLGFCCLSAAPISSSALSTAQGKCEWNRATVLGLNEMAIWGVYLYRIIESFWCFTIFKSHFGIRALALPVLPALCVTTSFSPQILLAVEITVYPFPLIHQGEPYYPILSLISRLCMIFLYVVFQAPFRWNAVALYLCIFTSGLLFTGREGWVKLVREWAGNYSYLTYSLGGRRNRLFAKWFALLYGMICYTSCFDV